MLKKQYQKAKPFCRVTFTLPIEAAPDANEVRLLGDFNDWDWDQGILMKADNGVYKTSVKLKQGRRYEFRYLVDGEAWINDWEADEYVSSPYHGIENSVVYIEDKSPEVKKANHKPASKKKVLPKKKDDLKKIEGIGPKIEQLLIQGGIDSFDALSKAKLSMLKNILKDAGPRYNRHDPGTWAKQAKLAAKGEWKKLSSLQKELKGGRKVK